MHDSFFGFYPPNQQEYDRLWKEGLIVFDTNALLDLYRLPWSTTVASVTSSTSMQKRHKGSWAN